MRLLDQSPAADVSGVARDHWRARLTLGFADDRGTTRLVERSHFGPLRVQKPLYPEHASVCHAIVVHTPGGVVGGDQLAITASVGADAHAFVTTPGAAKWYRANGHVSRQDIRLDIADAASLEWLPQETIFFNGADVALDTEVSMAADASFITSDIFCFGRTASGERFDHGRVAQRLQVRRGGKLVWFEQGALAGGDANFTGPLGLNGRTVCATLLAVGRPVVDDGHILEFHCVSRVKRQSRAQCIVVCDDAVGGLVARFGQVGVGGRARDVRNSAIVVDLRGGNGRAGIQVAHNASDFCVAKLLRNSRALLRISGIVFSCNFELDLLATDGEVLGIQIFNGHAHAIFVVLAIVGLATRHWRNVANLDHLHVLRGRHAGDCSQGGDDGQFQLQLHKDLQVVKS